MDEQSGGSQFVSVKLFDFIQIYPDPILSLYANSAQNRLYVSRTNYSEVYQLGLNLHGKPIIQQIAQLEPCQHFLQINGILALFKAFELKLFRNNRWQVHSFTTQLLSIRVSGHSVVSFHEREAVAWNFEEEDFSFRYFATNNAPYHLNSEGFISGMGKKIRNFEGKKSAFTCCEVIPDRYILVGDESGGLHVFDWRYLTHLTTFKKHEGPILAIKIDQDSGAVYFTGSDSRIFCIKQVGGQWRLSSEVRGQSHDILGLQLYNGYLISGGITTDLCFYDLLEGGQFSGEFINKVSYGGEQRLDNQGKFIIVNKMSSFEIWEVGAIRQRVKLLVSYQMPEGKLIFGAKISKEVLEDKTHLVIIITEEDTVGWKFNPETGLAKYVTIQNNYRKLQFLPGKNILLALKTNNEVEKVYCKSGKIQELFNCEVDLPTDFKILPGALLLVGSKITNHIKIFNYRTSKLIFQQRSPSTYTYIENLDQNSLIIKYFNEPVIYRISFEQKKLEKLVDLPVDIIRFGGWLEGVGRGDLTVKARAKKYWFGASQGKIVIISNLDRQRKVKVRVKQMKRIGQVIKPSSKVYGCNLAVVPIDFQRMIDQLPVKPLFTKKIV